ncbi:OmpA family protein [Allosphingosinicella sp.]|uniref:OmpA family protein n=1 Tax=Allosphingosinicella sp. TaxID=2823234 RepID=UPI003782DEB4
MTAMTGRPTRLLLAMIAGTVPGVLAAQSQTPPADLSVSVPAPPEAAATPGPRIEGIITARHGDLLQVMTADGARTMIAIGSDTRITSRGGFLSLGRTRLAGDRLLNGLPVSVDTLRTGGGGLVARRIDLRERDLRTAAMIHGGTAQQFAEQTAATAALRSRIGSIDQYNVRSTMNVTFAFGRATLSDQAKADLCATATAAGAIDNALLLVVGYTDSTGSQEVNQALSERRAGAVVNYLQQACHWLPYRMMTPTGMAEADPAADNSTPQGQAQNRRVQVSILVSKAVDGL